MNKQGFYKELIIVFSELEFSTRLKMINSSDLVNDPNSEEEVVQCYLKILDMLKEESIVIVFSETKSRLWIELSNKASFGIIKKEA
jgi:chromatin segregation and condensation protein Rec8/ScpA/Scc1 (kleisin family)